MLASLFSFAPATITAEESIAMPFPGGQAVKIIQGYNGGTHRGRSQYGLDLVLADGGTSGAEVVSPIDGSVTYSQSPKSGNGCMAIGLHDGSYSVMLCHIIFHRTFSRGEAIARGQSLGTVGPAGTVGNNGAPHVHLELHRGGRASSPVPFAQPDGLPLEDVMLAATGSSNEHGTRASIVSSNRAGGGVVASSTTRRGETTQRLADKEEPAPLTAASLASLGRSIEPAASAAAAPAAAATSSTAATSAGARTAVVHGTESCLKVRKQPSADAPSVECLAEGATVSLKPSATGADARWRQTDKGWVAAEFLKRTSAVVSGTDACLNVREGAKTGATLVGCLPEGTAVTIVEGPTTAGGHAWYRIEQAGSLKAGGWVVGKYLD